MSQRERYVRNSDLDLLTSQMTEQRLQKLYAVARSRQRGLCVVMEGVKNPFNLGAISRTVESFGVCDVHYTAPEFFDPKKTAKPVSKNSNKWVDYTYHETMSACCSHLHDSGWIIAATVISERAKPLYEIDWTQFGQVAVVIGNEHEGLSSQTVEAADVHVTIPMRGMSESLNVSVAMAITLSEITRQRAASDIDFRISEEAATALYEEYVRRAAAKWH